MVVSGMVDALARRWGVERYEVLMRAFTRSNVGELMGHAIDGVGVLSTQRAEKRCGPMLHASVIVQILDMPSICGMNCWDAIRNDEELSVSVIFVLITPG